MASGKTDACENVTLDAWFGSAVLGPATWHMALVITTAPTDSAAGPEPVGNGYARIAITNNATNFPAASGGSKTNGATITSAVSTGAWGTIIAVEFYDAATGGNRRFYADIDLANQQNINAANQQWSIPAGSLTITEN